MKVSTSSTGRYLNEYLATRMGNPGDPPSLTSIAKKSSP
jgi:hypothetical protein